MVNRVTLVGNLGADPESKYLSSGTCVTKIRIATNEKWRDANGELQERTEWHSVTLWRRLAEIAAQFLTKGRQVYIEGRLRNDTWEVDGQKRYGYHIEADVLRLLGRGDDSSQERRDSREPAVTGNDDIPF